MSLYENLQRAKTEEDVKDCYIKALKLKAYSKNLVDIQTEQVWFEAKEKKTSPHKMFAQLLCYVRDSHLKGEKLPPFLAVIDREQAALMETQNALKAIEDGSLDWPSKKSLSASAVSSKFVTEISGYIGTHFVLYDMKTSENEFIESVQNAIKQNKIVRIQITPNNLRQTFDHWCDLIGVELEGVPREDYALLFFADIMNDGRKSVQSDLPARLLYDGDDPVFSLRGNTFSLNSTKGYRTFWAIYHRPPAPEHRNELLERRDALLPIDSRDFKGAFYTPLAVVDKAYEYLEQKLGKNWQKNYLVWDMCCGVGNLEVKHSNYRNVFMSTLDPADVEIIKSTRTCLGATVFQYDYLNDDVTDDGELDYSLTNKMPKALIDAIKDQKKKLLVLINPPYAEATNFDNIADGYRGEQAKNKSGVASAARVKQTMMGDYGKAQNEISAQFLVRLAKEIPNATIAMFCTLKYVSSENFSIFRSKWGNVDYLGGFLCPFWLFDGLSGRFPISFLMWRTGVKEKSFPEKIAVDALSEDLEFISSKNFYAPKNDELLNKWFTRIRTDKTLPAVPLKNSVSVSTSKPRLTTWAEGAIGYMHCNSNDMQHAEQMTSLYSSVVGSSNGFYVTPENFEKTAMTFVARRIERPTWLNDRDQFYQPNAEVPQEFKVDSVVWMIFNRCNKTASSDDLEWDGRTWKLTNHFIPFTEQEVNAPDKFESYFLSDWLREQQLSDEAKAVMEQGRALWKLFFVDKPEKALRDEYHITNASVGWFQIRRVLEEVYGADIFDDFNTAYSELTTKLHSQAYEFGFLR